MGANRWESVRSEGKHIYWRYGVPGHAVGYVVRNRADCPVGLPFNGGIYPHNQLGQRIGWYRTVGAAKRAVEQHTAAAQPAGVS